MLIKAILRDKTCCTVTASELDRLLEKGVIAAFCKAGGWVGVHHDSIVGSACISGGLHGKGARNHEYP
jgi:hypothetical protein